MKILITLIFCFFLISCGKAPVLDNIWDRIQAKIEEHKKLPEADKELIEQATEKEWEETEQKEDK